MSKQPDDESLKSMWRRYNKPSNCPGGQLRLGAGQNARPQSTNWDIRDMDGIDEIVDLTWWDWPADDNEFQVITAVDVFEHLPPRMITDRETGDDNDVLINAVEECYRILKPGGLLLAQFPVPGGPHDYADPTHYRRLEPGTFTHFCPSSARWGKSIQTDARFSIVGHDAINNNYKIILRSE